MRLLMASPKSPSFTRPSASTKRFSGLMSLQHPHLVPSGSKTNQALRIVLGSVDIAKEQGQCFTVESSACKYFRVSMHQIPSSA